MILEVIIMSKENWPTKEGKLCDAVNCGAFASIPIKVKVSKSDYVSLNVCKHCVSKFIPNDIAVGIERVSRK